MADHPAVAGARAARGSMFQHVLTLSPHVGEQPKGRTIPLKADDPTPILAEIYDLGWDLVTTSVFSHAGSAAIGAVYVWQRR